MNNLAARVLYGGAFLLPLVYFPDTYDHFVLPKLLLTAVLVCTLLGFRVMHWAATGRLDIKRTPLDWPVLAFLASALIATGFAINRNVAVFGMYLRYEGLITLFLYAALYWLTFQTLAGPAQARTLIRALLAGAYTISVFAIVQWIGASLTVGALLNGDFSFQGLARAYGTMGNPTVLAAFLVMMLPAALGEFLHATSIAIRVLAANAMIVIELALGLTFARSAWVAALLAVIMVLAAFARRRPRLVLSLLVGGIVVPLLILAETHFVPRGGLPLGSSLVERSASVGSESSSFRLHVWADSVPLVQSRPLSGYGPDTFGIVFPRFASGAWAPGYVVDKAHAELLQIAASQGGLGVLAYLWLLGAMALAFWRRRAAPFALSCFAGLAGYQLWVQVNFSWIPAAALFWIFLGAAAVTWAIPHPPPSPRPGGRRLLRAGGATIAVTLIAASAITAVRAHNADASFLAALRADAAGDPQRARADLNAARLLAPTQGRYAFEAGRLLVRPDTNGRVDWWGVRQAYLSATQLGTYYPVAYRNLAVADRELGLLSEAVTAARRAVEQDPNDASNRLLLQDLEKR